ncbi:serine carboxypeptidase S28 family protein [Tanacetum coccineum]
MTHDLTSPLFLHPSDGPDSLAIQEKLIGAQNYRSWKRSVEIRLSTKRKLEFIRVTVLGSVTDATMQEQWDTCNNMVISWLMSSVFESIAKSIMFIGTAFEIWNQLEKRFALSNGSRKYKLNRETYDVMQSGQPISEYYTIMKCVWEELDSMNVLPRITTFIAEITAFLNAINTQKEEQGLFQFLNGLDDHFSAQRSQLLLSSPLPSVETACALLQQEESQREVFGSSQLLMESTALYSKTENKEKCSICGYKWHLADKCWEKIVASTESSGHIMFTSKQFKQLMRSLPHFHNHAETSNSAETDDELDSEYVAGLDNEEGHLSSSNLKHVPCDLLSKLNANSKVCLSCPMAKFTKLSYSYSKSHATEPFNLVHIDIWGPYKVPTNGNFRYFLTIVDDFSRATWTYFLEKKLDSFKFLTTFCKFVQTQFDSKVKVIRSDNALEFLKGLLGPYLTEQGIKHQTSCVDRPQQNGRVKRKHMHLLEIARALRFHSHLPLEFWGDLLLKKKPDYQNLRVFGCLAMASIPDRKADKFSPRGVPYYVTTTAPNAETQAAPNVEHATESITSATSTPLVFVQTAAPTVNAPISSVNAPRRSARNTTTPVWLQDYVLPTVPRANQVSVTHVQSHFQSFVIALLAQTTPTSFKQAVQNKDWCLAMNEELKALELNGTCEITDLLPTKNQLIAIGFIKQSSRLMMDVSNAFLHGDMFEDVYMKLPIGYTCVREPVQDVERSNKSFRCVQSKADYSLFTKQNGTSFTAILVYVDDLMITGTHAAEIQKLKSQLSSTFHMKDLGSLSYFLGLEVSRTEQGIFMS